MPANNILYRLFCKRYRLYVFIGVSW